MPRPIGKIGPRHLAFVRSWAEGVDVVAAWNRFLDGAGDGAGDARRARGELTRLRDQLGGLARIHGRPDIAALLRRDPEAMKDRGTNAPTLEEFAQSQPPDYYSESELVALYEVEHGHSDARSSARRRQRLRERLLAALQWLEQVGVRAPEPGDDVSAWLDERVAARLAAVGIRTLGELHFRVRTKGFHWHRAIPRVGQATAARTVRWLRDHAASLGDLPSPALVPLGQLDTQAATPAPRTGIVPLERFVSPADRDGSLGSNRAARDRCEIAAANDPEAVQAWLRLRVASSHTWRAYRKEAERFLLWAVLARGRALSSLDRDDCVAYQDFLAAPAPGWTGQRGAPRWSESWRPFEGPLSARSQATAVVIVRSLCAWLVRRRYLDANPWDDVPARAVAPPMARLRGFSRPQWALVQDWLQREMNQAPSAAQQRLHFLLEFGSMTGLRLAELASARLGWFRLEQLDGGAGAWSMRVPGARDKWRDMPLPDPAMQALKVYLLQRGLPADPLACDPQAPLIAKLAEEAPLSGSRIYDILTDAFERCAQHVCTGDKPAADHIRKGSTHWLRHIHGTQAKTRGAPPGVVNAAPGHGSGVETWFPPRRG